MLWTVTNKKYIHFPGLTFVIQGRALIYSNSKCFKYEYKTYNYASFR